MHWRDNDEDGDLKRQKTKTISGLYSTMLLDDCVSTILSNTLPLDACRSLSVSSSFRSAANSGIVWERLLPSDYEDIVSRSITPLKFSSKKEIFVCLCDPILTDGGNKSFALEKSIGLKSYILSARELSITWDYQPMYWIWKFMYGSRLVVLVFYFHFNF
ncbi:hypothetical protein HYC85_004473 [Camellia sinensis]|uniref:F-box domain-containing protein n=1 Tax=Camellia sinensis TaxID=4442 RepID=A0A7J7HZD2_CAMSI|nr:hypothetical protein HYC85_004473 [Camellia sinensis]